MTGTEVFRTVTNRPWGRRLPAVILWAGFLVAAGTPAAVAQVTTEAPKTLVRVAQARGWLGINVTVLHHADGRNDQIVVEDVWEGSPAVEAGVQVGDRVIRVNGAQVTGERFRSLTQRLEPGDPMTLGLLRQGREVEVTLVAGDRPDPKVLVPARLQEELDEVRNRLTQILEGSRVRVTSGSGGDSAAVHLFAPNIVVDRVDGDSITTRVVLAGDSVISAIRVGASGDGSRVAYSFETSQARPGQSVPFSVWVREADSTGVARVETLLRLELEEERDRAPVAQARGVGTPTSDGRVAGAEAAADVPLRPLAPFLAGLNRVAGAEMRSLTPELSVYFGVDEGVLVTHVSADAPAASAGLRAGDVIVEVNEVPVASVDELREILARTRSEVRLLLVRKGASTTVRLR
ncbi:MAG: PDZ domain-containing protein [Gemmatimonadales bacterium]|jgi:membrane-associated protease RseP (regulator of RpoE activity)|nr:MAG: PDZ domain-containing protein [Gemmatimonadales bacterium]